MNEKDSKIEICELKNENAWFEIDDDVEEVTFNAIDLEVILPLRVPEENFVDLLNLMRASNRIDGSDWKKALVSIQIANDQTSMFS